MTTSPSVDSTKKVRTTRKPLKLNKQQEELRSIFNLKTGDRFKSFYNIKRLTKEGKQALGSIYLSLGQNIIDKIAEKSAGPDSYITEQDVEQVLQENPLF
jgi:hypothetical protein